jgi:hypothetical protein
MKAIRLLGAMALIGAVSIMSFAALAKDRSTGRGTGPVVYVESQGLSYDSIVLADLPFKGDFQLLEPGVRPSGLATEFAPGDVGYLGGRWWVDANPNGVMDEEDVNFLCPLLGPGRSQM